MIVFHHFSIAPLHGRLGLDPSCPFGSSHGIHRGFFNEGNDAQRWQRGVLRTCGTQGLFGATGAFRGSLWNHQNGTRNISNFGIPGYPYVFCGNHEKAFRPPSMCEVITRTGERKVLNVVSPVVGKTRTRDITQAPTRPTPLSWRIPRFGRMLIWKAPWFSK